MKDKKPPLPPPPPAASPFAALAGLVTTASAPEAAATTGQPEQSPAKRGRVDVLRNTAHRGGKTVTVLKGFVGMSGDELKTLAKQLQKRCGAGGTVKDDTIELQGDHRETVMRVLAEAGFRPVKAGG